MIDHDYDEFSAILDAVCGLLSRGQYTPSAANTALWFGALAEHPIDEVRAGFNAHVKDSQRGRFVPVPSDILAQIEQHDGRPGAEEAWAIAMTGRDERDSVVWTPEIAQAWGVARIILSVGDEVGARMAFKESYAGALDAARRAHRPLEWRLAEGHDPARRIDAMRRAADMGRVVDGANELLSLPAPRSPATLLLADDAAEMPASARLALHALRKCLTSPRQYETGADVVERERTDKLRHETDVRVAEYVAAHGISMPEAM